MAPSPSWPILRMYSQRRLGLVRAILGQSRSFVIPRVRMQGILRIG